MGHRRQLRGSQLFQRGAPVIWAGIFALIAYFMMLLGRAMMQVLVVIVPVGAVVGVLPPGYGVLIPTTTTWPKARNELRPVLRRAAPVMDALFDVPEKAVGKQVG